MISIYTSTYDMVLEELFALHEDPSLFELLTPPGQAVITRPHTRGIEPGSVMEMRVTHPLLASLPVRVGGGPLGLTWRVRHTYQHVPHRFDDVQERGPFASWHHTHRFIASGDQTIIEDRIDWSLPILLRPATALVASMIDDLFAYRIAALNSYIRHC